MRWFGVANSALIVFMFIGGALLVAFAGINLVGLEAEEGACRVSEYPLPGDALADTLQKISLQAGETSPPVKPPENENLRLQMNVPCGGYSRCQLSGCLVSPGDPVWRTVPSNSGAEFNVTLDRAGSVFFVQVWVGVP